MSLRLQASWNDDPLAMKRVLHEFEITSIVDIVKVCRTVEKERTTRATDMNAESSRVHAMLNVFLYSLNSGNVHVNAMRFVDLCGSERTGLILSTTDKKKF